MLCGIYKKNNDYSNVVLFLFQDHNCVREMRSLIHSQQQKLTDFQQELAEQRFQISELKRDLHLVKVM